MRKRSRNKKKIKRAKSALEKIVICGAKTYKRIKAGAILFCEAQQTNTAIYFSENDYILSTKNIGYWQQRLPLFFWRIHDHWLINSSEIDDELNVVEGKLTLHNKVFKIARRRLRQIKEKYKKTGIS